MKTNMITEDYVSFETAKLLKERGYNQGCYAVYDIFDGKFHHNSFFDKNAMQIWCPTLALTMKWLREKYHLEIYPLHDAIQECNTWWYRVERYTKGCGLTEHESDSIYGKYEDACEAAIKYCLEKLI